MTKESLLGYYAVSNDPELLVPLSRLGVPLIDIAPMLLDAFGGLIDRNGIGRCLFERARVFEHLIQANLTYAVTPMDRYPTEFVYGVGRAQYQPALPYVLEVLAGTQQVMQTLRTKRRTQPVSNYLEWFREHSNVEDESKERMRLIIWTLGRLKAREVLVELAHT